jgi:hypothetical protein
MQIRNLTYDYLKNILDKKLLLYEMLINVSNLFAIKKYIYLILSNNLI